MRQKFFGSGWWNRKLCLYCEARKHLELERKRSHELEDKERRQRYAISEELKEFTWALGAEYWYQDSFALRLGYFNEHELKGARKFFTLGAGFKYNVVKIDVSYLFSASKVRNPLENTLRFSLTFNFGENYNEVYQRAYKLVAKNYLELGRDYKLIGEFTEMERCKKIILEFAANTPEASIALTELVS